MDTFITAFVFYFGAIIGSFLNVVILRLPNQQSLKGRSHCPSCGHTLEPADLFPLVSYLFLLGRCRRCHKKISIRYFLIEGLTGILFALAWLTVKPMDLSGYLLLARDFVVIASFITVFVIDLEHYLILDNVIFPAAGTILLLNLFLDLSARQPIFGLSGNFLSGLMAAVIITLPFFLLWFFSKGLWLGFGDVKLAILLGIALGWPLAALNLMLAVFLGGLASVFLLISRKKGLKSHVPFGTFLSLAGVVILLYGQEILRWYLSYLGF